MRRAFSIQANASRALVKQTVIKLLSVVILRRSMRGIALGKQQLRYRLKLNR